MSSDSSEDENLDLLREAVDSQFFNESMFTENPSDPVVNKTKTSKKELPPSLRKVQDEDEQFNLFRVTPEFQNYYIVAKHLSKALEEKLKTLLKPAKTSENLQTKKPRSGVRLFRGSKKFLKLEKYDKTSIKQSSVAKPRKPIEKVDEEVIKTLAVAPEVILNKTETKHWSNRTKAPVYSYKKSGNGILTLIEPKFQ